MAKARTRYKTLGRKMEGAAQLVLIADSAIARLLRLSGLKGSEVLVEVAVLDDPSVRRPARALGRERATLPLSDSHEAETQRFAKRVARRLDAERLKGSCGSVTIVAARHFLGVLRPALSKPTQQWISREIAKDLVHAEDAQILRTILA
jgi:protein required for attachment to host cells